MGRSIRLTIDDTDPLERVRGKLKVDTGGIKELYSDAVEQVLDDLGVVRTKKFDRSRKGYVYRVQCADEKRQPYTMELAAEPLELDVPRRGTPGMFWVFSESSDIAYDRVSIQTTEDGESEGKPITNLKLVARLFAALAESGAFDGAVIDFYYEGSWTECNIFYHNGIYVFQGNYMKLRAVDSEHAEFAGDDWVEAFVLEDEKLGLKNAEGEQAAKEKDKAMRKAEKLRKEAARIEQGATTA